MFRKQQQPEPQPEPLGSIAFVPKDKFIVTAYFKDSEDPDDCLVQDFYVDIAHMSVLTYILNVHGIQYEVEPVNEV